MRVQAWTSSSTSKTQEKEKLKTKKEQKHSTAQLWEKT